MSAEEIQSNRQARGSRKLLSPFLRIALLLGVCLHMIGFLVFRVISNPLHTRESSKPFVRYVSPESLLSGAELEEQVALFDSAPLFVPGRWNAAHHLQTPSRDRVLLRFPAYEPPADFSKELLPEGVPYGQDYGVEAPVDLLALRFWDLFRGIAGTEPAPIELETTGVFAEVRDLSGEVIRTAPVAIELLSMQAIQPATYYLRVESGGRALGRPTLSASSGDTAFDAAVYTWLSESGFSAGLSAGLFQVSVYP